MFSPGKPKVLLKLMTSVCISHAGASAFLILLRFKRRILPMRYIFVALGGAIGAVGRYAISLISEKPGFPVLTLITNVLGAVLIGFVAGLVSQRDNISSNTVLFWTTGVCGGFTTFSTFSLEAFSLLENHQIVEGSIYVVLSVALCLAGIFFGRRLAVIMA